MRCHRPSFGQGGGTCPNLKLALQLSRILTKCPPSILAALQFAEVKEELGVIDVLIFNPGLKSPSILNTDIMDIKIEEFNATHQLFCAGALLCVQEVLPDMVAKSGDATTKKGTILFTGATAGYRGSAKGAIYSAAEFGMRSLSQSVARGYASKGIHCCFFRLDCVIDTPWVVAMM